MAGNGQHGGPQPVEEGNFHYNDDEFIHYEVYGDGAIPLVLIHGFASSARNWDDLVARLVSAEPTDGDAAQTPYKIYAIDCKGTGASSKPPNSDYSIPAHAKIVADFVRHKGLDNYVLAGHSMGGGVALMAALVLKRFADSPDQSGIILLDTACYPTRLPQFIQVLGNPWTRWIPLYFMSAKSKGERAVEAGFHDQSKATPEIVGRYANLWRIPGFKRATATTAAQIVPPNHDALIAKFHTIDCPTLVIWGRQDRVLDWELGERLVNDLPNAELAVVEECGHCPMEERPDEVARLFADFAQKIIKRSSVLKIIQ